MGKPPFFSPAHLSFVLTIFPLLPPTLQPPSDAKSPWNHADGFRITGPQARQLVFSANDHGRDWRVGGKRLRYRVCAINSR